MRDQLRAALPKEATKPHPSKVFLTAIKAIYVVERLNDVFGVGSWETKSKAISVNDKGMVVVHSRLIIPEYGIKLEAFGGNDNGGENSKNFDLGDAYKGACTDAFTKMCSYLEIGIEIFKGNGNKDQPKQEAVKPTQTPMSSTSKKGAQILLIPNNTEWVKLIKGLTAKAKNKTDWPNIKLNYIISDNDEKELFKQMSW